MNNEELLQEMYNSAKTPDEARLCKALWAALDGLQGLPGNEEVILIQKEVNEILAGRYTMTKELKKFNIYWTMKVTGMDEVTAGSREEAEENFDKYKRSEDADHGVRFLARVTHVAED